jgi:GNAT superfamily N-acetyltransferase
MRIFFADPTAADDHRFVANLATIVNRAYAVAEAGLWHGEAVRTSPEKVAKDVREGSIVVAEDEGTIVGSVKTFLLCEHTGWFGALAVDPDHGGRGVGGALVAFAEDQAAQAGASVMQIEILLPLGRHVHTDWLRRWYEKRGYEIQGQPIDYSQFDPENSPDLALPVRVAVMKKRLNRR